jgi:DNA adenine methylase
VTSLPPESAPQPYRAVKPCRPAAAWIGGKKILPETIAAKIALTPHRTYVEPFAGMGGVFLRRESAPPCEVINDISADVANLYRILQRHYEALMDLFKWQITSRQHFDRLIATPAESLTDLERAARFLYLQRLAFGGKVAGRNFGISHGLPGRFDVTKLAGVLEAIHDRLAGVVIENLPWREVLARWDTPETLFYCDPPYHGSEHYYGRGLFQESDFAALASALATIKSRFILSINDTPLIRQTFARFELHPLDVVYTAARDASVEAAELLIAPIGAGEAWRDRAGLFG